MKKLSVAALILGFCVLCAGVVYGTVLAAHKYLPAGPVAAVAACQKPGVHHSVDVKNNAMVPEHTQASLCDTLTITNQDASDKLIAFGPHDNHQPYDGVREKLLTNGQRLTITLNRRGTYFFHDHIEDIATGDFTVK